MKSVDNQFMNIQHSAEDLEFYLKHVKDWSYYGRDHLSFVLSRILTHEGAEFKPDPDFVKEHWGAGVIIFCNVDSVLAKTHHAMFIQLQDFYVDCHHVREAIRLRNILMESEFDPVDDVEVLSNTFSSVITTCWNRNRTLRALTRYIDFYGFEKESFRVYDVGHRIV
jgi:hypothetical protein